MPDTPSVNATSANLIRVSVIASSAPRTRSGCARRASRRRDLQEIRTIALVEPQRGLGRAGGVGVDLREMAPERVGRAVGGLAVDGGGQTLAAAHLLHRLTTPRPRTECPAASTASKW